MGETLTSLMEDGSAYLPGLVPGEDGALLEAGYGVVKDGMLAGLSLIHIWTGVLLLSDYLGLLTCLGLSVIAYLKIWGREKWIKSIVIGVCMVAFLYGVFVLFLHVPVPKGPLGF